MIDSGTDDDRLLLLRDVGLLRIERERERGGVDLPIPEQQVEAAGDGHHPISSAAARRAVERADLPADRHVGPS